MAVCKGDKPRGQRLFTVTDEGIDHAYQTHRKPVEHVQDGINAGL
ncbi:Uncharacterised protein [Enterobacter cloacae]|nr:Uncharacterised protein [Enterobacter cloacae]